MKHKTLGLTLSLLLQGPLWATPTENTQLKVLPAGKIVVDGKTDDWDLSGGTLACDDVENQRDKLAVWIHAAYDKENLYLVARFRDHTPMNNPGQTIADYGFAGDCLQFRVITGFGTPDERASHWTNWRGVDGGDVMDIAYGRDFKGGVVKNAKDQGAQQAFTKDADGKGYIQEMAIPWKLLTKDGAMPDLKAGFRFTVEPNFSIGVNGRMTLKDIFQPNIRPDRVFTFMAAQHWGPAVFEARGNIAPPPVRLADAREFPVSLQNGVPVVDWTGLILSAELPGFKPLDFTMPEDGYVSLNIKSEDGTVVRQLLNSAFFTKGKHSIKWDGLTTPNAKLPGEPVAPGTYSWQGITNTGIGLKLRGWADNAGNAPWDNGPDTNWGGDHGDPVAAASDGSQVYLGWTFAEAGQALLACDLEGKPKWKNKRGGMAGVHAVASDGTAVYVLGGGAGINASGGALYKLNALDGQYLAWGESKDPDLIIKSLASGEKPAQEKADFIAAAGGQIFLSFGSAAANYVTVLDAKTGSFVKQLNVVQPGALKATGDGKLYVLSAGKSVQVVDLGTGESKTLIDNLTNASALAVAKDGRVFVGTRDPDNQVFGFDPQGKPLLTIGRKGGRNLLGKWTPDGLRFIQSLTVAADGKLWVAEQDGLPRRMTAWDSKTGKLVREYFGPTTYGALGGAIDPQDANVMVGSGCEWRLDPATGTAQCVSVITRDGMENSRFGVGSNGRLYLAVAPGWIHEQPFTSLYERVGEGEYKLRGKFTYGYKAPKDLDPKTPVPKNSPANHTSYWADANGDGLEQPEEITEAEGNLRFSNWFMDFSSDLTFYVQDSQFKPAGFTAAGAPLYALTKPIKLPPNPEEKSVTGIGSSDGSMMVYNGKYNSDRSVFSAFDVASGKLKWTYPNNFVGVHGSHNATPPEVGMIRGAFGITGSAKLPAPIGNIWVIPTNVGEWHVLTENGFYLTRLFEGDPLKQKWPEKAGPGAIMDATPPGMGGEDFGGSVTYGTDKKLYIQAGKTGFWNLEVTGLETVAALPGGKLSIASEDLPKAQALRESQLQQVVGKARFMAKKMTPTLTGDFDKDFKNLKEVTVVTFKKSNDAEVRASATWDDTCLHLAWDVVDGTPWLNAAKTAEEMYVSGDTVDFQLATDTSANPTRSEPVLGDLRVSIGALNGNATAVLYRKVSTEKKPKTFSSGVVKSYPMEFVDVIAEAKIKVTKRDKGYVVEASIPLAALDLKPAEGAVLRGDFGVTHGGPGGDRTRLRTYWNNQKTGIVDDVVFELMMEPKNWGEIVFAP
jgi:hypothetical protein